MPFGLTNAPAIFQRLMECVLAGLTGEQYPYMFTDFLNYRPPSAKGFKDVGGCLARW